MTKLLYKFCKEKIMVNTNKRLNLRFSLPFSVSLQNVINVYTSIVYE